MPVVVQQETFRRYAGHTTAVTIDGEQFRLTAARGRDGTLAEVTIGRGRHYGCAEGLLQAYATALSAGLDRGVPLAELLRSGLGLRFSPDGSTDDPDIPYALSVVDYCCRRLAIDWLPAAERATLGVVTPAERPVLGVVTPAERPVLGVVTPAERPVQDDTCASLEVALEHDHENF
jgi:ribonucleoside-diphosphate reductase alpha chain